jgi:ElaB/YqjD/DUF883 family membrane-anchored ribosome-binding protein
MNQLQPAEILQKARSGNLAAIRQLMMQTFQSQSIRTQVSQNANELKIFLDAKKLPDQASTIDILQRGMRDLKCPTIEVLKIVARSTESQTEQWSHEVFLTRRQDSNIAQKLVNQEQVGKLLDNGLKRTQDLAKTSQGILQDLPLKTISKVLGGGALGVGLVTGGIFGVRTGLDTWSQHQIFQETDRVIAVATSADAMKTSESIQMNQNHLNAAREKIAKLISISGQTGKKAKAKVAKIDQQIDILSQRLTLESDNSDVLSAAEQIIIETQEFLQAQPHTLSKWSQAKGEMAEMTDKLQNIPPESSVAASVKVALGKLKQQEISMSKAMMIEEKAFQSLVASHKIAQRASDVTDTEKNIGFQPNLENLEKAISIWQQAIDQLKKVPPKSGTHTLIAEYQTVYKANRDVIAAGIKSLTECKAKSPSDPVVADISYCSYTLSPLAAIPLLEAEAE